MNLRSHLAIGMLVAVAAPALAQEALPSLPTVHVPLFVTDCAHPSLPSQRQVGEWTGLQNFAQVYAARERLMTGIGRACQRQGVSRVQVVMDPGSRQGTMAYVAQLARPQD